MPYQRFHPFKLILLVLQACNTTAFLWCRKHDLIKAKLKKQKHRQKERKLCYCKFIYIQPNRLTQGTYYEWNVVLDRMIQKSWQYLSLASTSNLNEVYFWVCWLGKSSKKCTPYWIISNKVKKSKEMASAIWSRFIETNSLLCTTFLC